MSTWGTGNFDNDLACEVLLRIVFQLIHEIKSCIESDHVGDLVCGETILVPSVDILLTLGKAYPEYVVPALRETWSAEWKDKYLSIFELHSEVPMDDPIEADR